MDLGALIDVRYVKPNERILVDDVFYRTQDGYWRVTDVVEVDGVWLVDAVNADGAALETVKVRWI